MSEKSFYSVTVKIATENAKGAIKWNAEKYIVEGVTPTDVEAIIGEELKGEDFEISNIKLEKIVKILKK